MSIIPLKNNLNWSDRKFHYSQNVYHFIQRNLIEKGDLRFSICLSLMC